MTYCLLPLSTAKDVSKTEKLADESYEFACFLVQRPVHT